MTLHWKNAAIVYRRLFDEAMTQLVEQETVIAAATELKRLVEKPSNPLVKLFGSESIEQQRAQKVLFQKLDELEEVLKSIQSYS